MTLSTYIQCAVVGIIGMLLHAIMKARSIQRKAKLANVEFKISEYFLKDWLSHSASFLTVILCLFLIDEFANISQYVMSYLKIGFAFVGYTGSDIASRFFSVVNEKVNRAIDFKTTIADEASHTTDKPTPK